MKKLSIILFITTIVSIILGFILGWLFPINGPYDEAYKKKKAGKQTPTLKKTKEVIVMDNDLMEWYYLIPKYDVDK